MKWLALILVVALGGCATNSGYRYASDGYWSAPQTRHVSLSVAAHGCGGFVGFGFSPFAWHPCTYAGWHGPWRHPHWYRTPSMPAPMTSPSRAAHIARAMAQAEADRNRDRWLRYDDMAPQRRRDYGPDYPAAGSNMSPARARTGDASGWSRPVRDSAVSRGSSRAVDHVE